MREMVGGCCVCSDDRGWSENPLVYCDGQLCTVAVHQACYGIVTVPIGPWYCRKCESQERSVKVKCELCPSKYGALKRTDNSGWAHVVCALYIPEVRFGNVTTMEPIQLQLIPAERFNKVCYICEEKGKASSATVGACMQCNKSGCKQQFHVTCAQGLGLLCEEAGNYLDNVKYCGYCQHHYSKLKKWGNVKTIPPYKPISTENHLSDSNSEKELESGPSSTTPSGGSTTTGITTTKPSSTSPATGKRKSSSGSKSSSSKSSSSSSAPSGSKSSSSNSSSQQKTVHSNSKSSDKSKVINSNSSKSAKSDESNTSVVSGQPPPVIVTETVLPDITKRDTKSDTVESVEHNKVESGKEGTSNSKSSSKKRKVNSRTPTPVSSVSSAIVSDISVVVNSTISGLGSSSGSDKKISDLPFEKPKKPKIETTQSILTNQPVVALTSISTIKASSPVTTVADIATTSDTAHSALPTQSIIQTQPVNSLLVSVPLTSTSLSPHHPSILNNQTSVLTPNTILQEHNSSVERTTPINTGLMTGGNSNSGPAGMLTSEMSGGGLKITYEKQDSINTEVDMELEVSPQPQDIPAKRGRSQSHDKTDRSSRGKKRSSGANGINAQLTSSSSNPGLASKRSSRSHHSTPPPIQQQPSGAFSSITQAQLKDSPPSSPSSESQGAPPTNRSSRSKSRKSAPAAVNMSSSSKDTKDIKLFQNGVAAPHMLGNQLNPNSNMAQKMNDHLNSELEAHSIFNPNDNNSNLIGPQLHHRVVQSARASSAGGSSTASGGSGLSSMIGGGGGNIPQTLDQLLERQWEQGSQFLMEQAQHFDIASLLSCLHQLRAENLRLEEDVASLLQRRDHLLAVNARLAIPLTGQPATPQSGHPHTVNNIHPSLPVPHGDLPRPPRHTSGSYSSHSTAGPVENGLPPDQAYMQHSHRSPSGSQSSPTVRHSSSGSGYGSSGQLQRQNADTSGRSAPRPQPYPLYQGPGSSSQAQQQVIRRDSDLHHQNSSKPS